MTPEEFREFREQMRKACLDLARVCFILAGTVLATEYLFPSRDRSWVVIGPAIGLLCSSVFAMARTSKSRKDSI